MFKLTNKLTQKCPLRCQEHDFFFLMFLTFPCSCYYNCCHCYLILFCLSVFCRFRHSARRKVSYCTMFVCHFLLALRLFISCLSILLLSCLFVYALFSVRAHSYNKVFFTFFYSIDLEILKKQGGLFSLI